MSANDLTIDKVAGTVEFVFLIDSKTFEDAKERVYQKKKGDISLPGFRKGKAPRDVIEKVYGSEVFYNDAINEVLPSEYQKAEEEFLAETEVVGNPNFDLVSMSDEGVKLKAKLVLRPEGQISDSDYKNLEYIKADKIAVNDDDVNKAIDEERKKNARIMTVDRPAEMGDSVNLNCQGYVDGKAFEAGKAENYDLVIGSKTFIDNFEEQLIGSSAGDEVEVHVTFPEKYHVEELSSKPALFKVKINRVSKMELPEANDDFAQEVSEFDTFDEYKADVRKKMEGRSEEIAKNQALDQLLDVLAQKVRVDIPKVMIDGVKENMLRNFEQNLKTRNLTLESYMIYANRTREALLDSYTDDAIKQLRIRLALEAIARNENLDVSDEDIEKEIDKIAEQTRMARERIESFLNKIERRNMKKDLAVQKAMDFVYEHAIAKESTGTTGSESELKTKIEADTGNESDAETTDSESESESDLKEKIEIGLDNKLKNAEAQNEDSNQENN